MISESKRKQLEAAGYSVSKSGKTVTKGGGTIAGINDNGNFFGSGKALDILKGVSKKTPKKDSDTKAEAKGSAPKSSPKPRQRQTGRGEPNYGKASNEAIVTPMGGPRRGKKPSLSSRIDSARAETDRVLKETAPIDRGVTYDEWEAMTRAERRAAGLPLTKVGWQNQRLTYKSSKPASSKSFSTTRSDDAKARATRTNRSRNSPDIPGMAKGGMVKKGTKDYKKSGMFYKSESPRGYK